MNRTSIASVIGILLLVAACQLADQARPKADAKHAEAAADFTKRYSLSRFAEWQIRARPAGSDCRILLIETGILMDPARIEAIQYGVNSPEIVEGGAHGMAREKGFRGIVYRDAGGKTWVYDDEPRLDPKTATPCR